MDYNTRRYKQGLEGKKPSSIYLDKAAHRAQRAGYRDYLRNRDLAEQIRLTRETDSGSSYDYESSSSSESLQWWQAILCLALGVVLLYGDYWVSDSFATYASRDGQYYWPPLIFSILILPGGILGWPAFVCIAVVVNEYFPSSSETKPESSTEQILGAFAMLAVDAVLAWGIMKMFTHDVVQPRGFSGIEIRTYWIGFGTYFFIFPGGFLFFPAMKSLYKAMSK